MSSKQIGVEEQKQDIKIDLSYAIMYYIAKKLRVWNLHQTGKKKERKKANHSSFLCHALVLRRLGVDKGTKSHLHGARQRAWPVVPPVLRRL